MPFEPQTNRPGTGNPTSKIVPVFWLMMLFALALGVRLYRLEQPPLDFHQVRQYIGAVVARDYYFQNNPGIPDWQRDIAHFTKEHTGLLEPQILPALAKWGYQLAGGERLWIPRCISIACWLLGGVFLWQILTPGFSRGAAIVSLAFYLLMPYGIMASRSFQPDPMMLMLTLCCLRLVMKYDGQPNLGWLMASTIVLLAGMAVRPMAIVFVFPPFFLLLAAKKGLFRSLFHWHAVLFALIPLIPAAAFYIYTAQHGGFIKAHGSTTFMPHLLKEPFFWDGWLKMIGRTTGWLPALGALLAALFIARGSFKLMLLGLWGGYFAYGLIFDYHIFTHDYYSLPLLPIVALSLAPLTEMVLVKFTLLWSHQRRLLLAAIVGGLGCLALVALPAKGFLKQQLSPQMKARFKSAGAFVGFDRKFLLFLGREDKLFHDQVRRFERIGELVGHTRRSVFLVDDYGTALEYHGQIYGFAWPTAGLIRHYHATGRPTMETVEDFEAVVRREQAEYFIVTFLEDFDLQEKLKAHVTASYPVFAQDRDFVIYRLTRP